MNLNSMARFPSSVRETQSKAASGHSFLFLLLLVVLVWAPIPIGSNRTWSMALLEMGTLVILGVWALGYVLRPFELTKALRRSRLALIVLSAWIVYPLVQLIPLPPDLVEILGGRVHDAYFVAALDGEPDVAYLSVDRGATLAGFMWQCSLVALFVVVLALIHTSARMHTLMLVMFAVGFMEAVYGLLIYLGGEGIGLWNPGYAQGVVSGTYVNQNHFAGLLELTIPLGLGLLLYYYDQQGSGRKPGKRWASLVFIATGQSGIILFGTLVMTSALILTTSRGGVGALALGIGTAVLLAAATRGTRAREIKLVAVVALLVAVALFWIGPGQFQKKVESAGLSSQRDDLRDISYQIVADSPLFGTGVGTYRWVFPTYKDERFGGNFYEHAHNDYLEVLGEQGIVGFALLTSATLIIVVRILRAYTKRRDPFMRSVLFAVIAGCVSLLVHGLVDFNLHIPANAFYFVSLLALGLVACDARSRTELRSNRVLNHLL